MAHVSVPDGQTAVKVTIIDNGARVGGPYSAFLDSDLMGRLKAPAYVFLVEHGPSRRRILFDLGIRKNPEEYAPAVKAASSDFSLDPGEEIADFLRDRGVDPSTIEGIVLSHHHPDHVGNPAAFPPTTGLIVGPGFKETILPGYPKNPEAQILESDYEGRDLRQVDFDAESGGLAIGGFRALDYFGDGSFYLLETPGHTINHLAGFARTGVSPSRFIFMGGDIAHHASQWRPTELVPLPHELSPSPLGPRSRLNACCGGGGGGAVVDACPGELFARHAYPHPRGSGAAAAAAAAAVVPFHGVRPGLPHDAEMAQSCVDRLRAFDADDRVLVVAAHDASLAPVLRYHPEEANGWHAAGWKERGRWEFLRDLAGIVEANAEAAAEAEAEAEVR